MDDERIDFSVLDPSRDQVRWARTVEALATRALGERRKQLSIGYQLLHWARPVLAVAAGLSLMAWTAGYLTKDKKEVVTSMQAEPALTIAHWAANNQIPETTDLWTTLRGNP